MEWHFGSDIEDLVVSKDKEMSEGPSLPYSLSPWDKATLGSFISHKKHTIAEMEELQVNVPTSSSEVDQLGSSSVCIDSREDFIQRSDYPCEELDLQLTDFARFDEADDIFVRSLFEENGNGIHAAGSVIFSPTSSNNNVIPSNCSRDVISDSQNFQENIGHIRHSRDFKEYAFSVSSDCKNEAKDDPFLLEKATEVDIPFSLGHSSADKYITEVMTPEESVTLEKSVYLELKSLTLQLTENTRICLRDALYRLAENSQHKESNHIQDGNEIPEDCLLTTYSEVPRFRNIESEAEEPTNAIDRTVANLLFTNVNFPQPHLYWKGR